MESMQLQAQSNHQSSNIFQLISNSARNPNSQTKEFSVLSIGRIQRDLQDLRLHGPLSDEISKMIITSGKWGEVSYELDLSLFVLEGTFSGIDIHFQVVIDKSYPFSPVKIYSKQFIYHPNFDFKTYQVYLHMTHHDNWTATITLLMVFMKLKLIFYQPDSKFIPSHSENIDAIVLYQADRQTFRQKLFQYYSYNDTSHLENKFSNSMVFQNQEPEDQKFDLGILNENQFHENQNINFGNKNGDGVLEIEKLNIIQGQNFSSPPFVNCSLNKQKRNRFECGNQSQMK